MIDREVVLEHVRTWIKDDLGTACKMTLTADVANRLVDRLTAALRAPAADPVGGAGWRELLQETRREIVLAIAFLGRDQGTERMGTTVSQIIERLVAVDSKLLAAAPPPPPVQPAPVGERGRVDLSRLRACMEQAGFNPNEVRPESYRHFSYAKFAELLTAPSPVPAVSADVVRAVEALKQCTQAEHSNAARMRDAIVEARRRLAKGRALWNGPCHECDAVLDQALRANNDVDAIARAALSTIREETGR